MRPNATAIGLPLRPVGVSVDGNGNRSFDTVYG